MNIVIRFLAILPFAALISCGGGGGGSDGPAPPPDLKSLSRIDAGTGSTELGGDLFLKAFGTYTDGTEHQLDPALFTWASSNTAAVPVDDAGHASTVKVGNSTITATLKEPLATGSALSTDVTVLTPVAKRPINVLFLVTEDQGTQAGFLGTSGLSTPHMDALASGGASYTNAFVTQSLCTTTKASWWTGLFPHTSGVIDNVQDFVGSAEELEALNPPWLHDPNSKYNRYRIHDDVLTLEELLHAAGYFTGLQNKLHVSPNTKFPFDHWQKETGKSYDEISAFLKLAKASGRPWFLMHNIGNSHRPYPRTDKGQVTIDPATVEPPGLLPPDDVSREDWTEYLQAIRQDDTRMGQVMQALSDEGVGDETLILWIGDHGPAYHRGKGSTYKLGLNVPLVWKGAGVHGGVVRQELFSGADIMPTILDFVGLEKPARMQGVSHYALLTGATVTPPHQYVVGEWRHDRSIFDGRWHLVFMPLDANALLPDDDKLFATWGNRVYDDIVSNKDTPGYQSYYKLLDQADRTLPDFKRQRIELYDTATDPDEIHDLSAAPEAAAHLAELKAALNAWMDETTDDQERP